MSTDLEIASIGDNNPPEPINEAVEAARAAWHRLNGFLTNNPAVDESNAEAAKVALDTAKASLKSLEDSAKKAVAPKHDAWKAEIAFWGKPKDALGTLVGVLTSRVEAFLKLEKARRQAILDAEREKERKAEAAAREAERLEQEAIRNAKQGEVLDVGTLIEEADEKFGAFAQQSRFTARAARDVKNTRLGGGIGNAVGLRRVEVLVINDLPKAVTAMSGDEGLQDAVKTAARLYRRATGDLPPGITSTYEEKI